MLGMEVTEEQLQSIVERAIQEADLDRDDAFSFEEFKKVNLTLWEVIASFSLQGHFPSFPVSVQLDCRSSHTRS